MSMRTIACSSSNRNSANAFANSVLPTPVGPRNMNEPVGRLGSAIPARLRRTASETACAGFFLPTAAAARGIRNALHGLLLADDALAELVLHAQQLGGLTLEHPACRDAGPRRHH